MRTLLLAGLLALAGCRSVVGPFESRRKERADDPLLTTSEQKKKARSMYPFPDEDLGPRSGVARDDAAPPQSR